MSGARPVPRSRAYRLVDVARWPLVDRECELRTIAAALTACPRRSLVITGPAGVGRTRLAREALALAEQRGHPTRWAAATSAAAMVPLGALAHLLPAVDVGSCGLALLQQATAAIAGDRSGPPTVLGVDDVHLLDQMSVTLLHQLAASGAVVLVLTLRSGSTSADPAAPLWKDGLADRLQLEPLRRTEALRLVGRVLGGDVDSRTAQRLWELSGGNPLFLRELLEDGMWTGRLADPDGLWRWDGALRPSQRLCDIVLAQLGELGAVHWRLLEAFATAEPLPVHDVDCLVGQDAVAEMARRGVVADAGAGSSGLVRLAHPLYAEVIRSRAPGAALRLVRRHLGDGLREGGARPATAAWSDALLDGGGPAPDAGRLTEAAWRAAALLHHPVAERLARAAIEAGGGCRAHLALAEAAGWLRSPAQVDELAAAAERAATTADERAEATAVRVLGQACAQLRPEPAGTLVAEPVLDANSTASRALLAAAGALRAHLMGAPRRAIDEASAVLASPAHGQSARGLASAAAALGLAVTGSTGAALASVAQGRSAVEAAECGPLLAVTGLALSHAEVLALHFGGRIRELEQRAAELHEANLATPEWSGDGVAALHRGWAAFAAGRMSAALRWLAEAEAGLRRADPLGALPLGRALRATVRALVGDVDGARRLVAQLDEPGCRTAPVHVPLVLLARAQVAAAEGSRTDAARFAQQASDCAAQQDQPAIEALVLHLTSRVRCPAGTGDRLRELAERLDSPLVAALAAYATAVASEDGNGLDLLSRRLEDAGLLMVAAEAAAGAASVLERCGARRAAAAAMTRALTLTRECGLPGSPSPDLSAPPTLTAREEEVARLAGRGMSNVAIADRLVVSVRTVEAHLSHIYGKLGITSRADLADTPLMTAVTRPPDALVPAVRRAALRGRTMPARP